MGKVKRQRLRAEPQGGEEWETRKWVTFILLYQSKHHIQSLHSNIPMPADNKKISATCHRPMRQELAAPVKG